MTLTTFFLPVVGVASLATVIGAFSSITPPALPGELCGCCFVGERGVLDREPVENLDDHVRADRKHRCHGKARERRPYGHLPEPHQGAEHQRENRDADGEVAAREVLDGFAETGELIALGESRGCEHHQHEHRGELIEALLTLGLRGGLGLSARISGDAGVVEAVFERGDQFHWYYFSIRRRTRFAYSRPISESGRPVL